MVSRGGSRSGTVRGTHGSGDACTAAQTLDEIDQRCTPRSRDFPGARPCWSRSTAPSVNSKRTRCRPALVDRRPTDEGRRPGSTCRSRDSRRPVPADSPHEIRAAGLRRRVGVSDERGAVVRPGASGVVGGRATARWPARRPAAASGGGCHHSPGPGRRDAGVGRAVCRDQGLRGRHCDGRLPGPRRRHRDRRRPPLRALGGIEIRPVWE
jgi:hypothetical protein